MKLKGIAIGTGVLLVLAIGGSIIDRQSNSSVVTGKIGQPLFGNLDLSKAIRIIVEKEENKVTLNNTNQGWVVEEMENFPADQSKIRKFILKLSDEVIEHKVTEKQEKLAGLGLLKLEENDGKFEKDKTADSFSVIDSSGNTIYSLLLGINRSSGQNQGGGYGGQYIRFPDEQAAYLIGDSIFLDKEAHTWIDKEIFPADLGELLKQITITRSDKKKTVFSRPEGEKIWELAGTGEAELDKNQVNNFTRKVASLKLFKIAQKGLGDKKLGRGKVSTIQMELFDSRAYNITVGEEKGQDDLRYITLSAQLPMNEASLLLRKEVEDFNIRFQDRILSIQNYDGEQLLKGKKDFLKKK